MCLRFKLASHTLPLAVCIHFGAFPISQAVVAEEPPCTTQEFLDPVEDILVYDTQPPQAETRIQEQRDIDIKFRWFADYDECPDRHLVTHAIRNLQTGENSSLIFLWEEALLSRPSSNPLRSLSNFVNPRKLDISPTELESKIKFSPLLSRETSSVAYALSRDFSSSKQRSTWSKVITDFINEAGEVWDLLFTLESKFVSSKIHYTIEMSPDTVSVGIGEISGALTGDALSNISETLADQGFSLEVVDLTKLVDATILTELPAGLSEMPLVLIRPTGDKRGRSTEAKFNLSSSDATNVLAPIVLFSEEDEPIAAAGVSIYIP